MNSAKLVLDGVKGQRILRLYHLYRLVIGLILVLLISSNLHQELLDLTQPEVF